LRKTGETGEQKQNFKVRKKERKALTKIADRDEGVSVSSRGKASRDKNQNVT
jgi:hypothetical protein